jgi:hypothetical protein
VKCCHAAFTQSMYSSPVMAFALLPCLTHGYCE